MHLKIRARFDFGKFSLLYLEMLVDLNFETLFFSSPVILVRALSIPRNSRMSKSVYLSINAPSKSMSKILILAVDLDDRKQFHHTEKFKNLDITKVNIGIEGVEKVNALYASGMEKWNVYDQILKSFQENEVTLRDFLTEKYAPCFDLRPSTDLSLHRNGARLEDTSEGVTLETNRIAGGVGKLNLHLFVFQDFQLNISGGRFHSVEA